MTTSTRRPSGRITTIQLDPAFEAAINVGIAASGGKLSMREFLRGLALSAAGMENQNDRDAKGEGVASRSLSAGPDQRTSKP